jgi:hypothetical protein
LDDAGALSAAEKPDGQIRFAGTAVVPVEARPTHIQVLVDGAAYHPTRPAPFIRVDTEK